MMGGLATLATFALVDALLRRSMSAWRAFVFVLLTGTICAMLTGLWQIFFPDFSPLLIHTLQNSLGLICAALWLNYLGLWLGVATEDRMLGLTINLGAIVLVLVAGAMAVLTLVSPQQDWHDLLLLAALLNGASIALPTMAAIRAVTLGDQLAKGVFVDNVLLACMVYGLYARGLNVDMGIGACVVTAVSTVGSIMLGTYLGLRRDRINRQLKRMAALAQGDDPATGLPQGSILLSKVDDAFWRTARRNLECTVICLHVANLYELAETAGHHADKQILAALSARLRRAVGFRNVVGLYHPRCFVVVISAGSKTRLVVNTLQRMHYLMAKPLRIVGSNDVSHIFTPRFGIGAVAVTPSSADAAREIDQAERLALAQYQDPPAQVGDTIPPPA